MPEEKVRKPRPRPAPYKRSQTVRKPKGRPKTSATTEPKHASRHLTLNDWLTVVTFCDANPIMTQEEIMDHFSKLRDGALKFTQSSLSRHISKDGREADLTKLAQSTNALSTRRARTVTRPDVERCLVVWSLHMEEKGKIINGPMLSAKRERLEMSLNVPEEQRLRSTGWIPPFCKAYHGLRNIRRHGEAGSVDTKAVEEEKQRLSVILSAYEKRDRWNFDETGLYVFAPPDRGLARKQMSGEKTSKFRITIGFACNADGSERAAPFFIHKYAKPRCFGKRSPVQRGFYYRNNAKAWMTAAFFEEWVKYQDMFFRQKGRKICLLIDNFSGHKIGYEPTNIRLEFLAPNMTSFVQPLDAGIIRCFKAHYRRAVCLRAIEQDEAGEDDVFKLDLLEAMLLVDEAWWAIKCETMENCWTHTKIEMLTDINAPVEKVPDELLTIATPPALKDLEAWKLVVAFAEDPDATFPDLVEKLTGYLTGRYVYEEWKPAFDVVFDAEGDSVEAVTAVTKLMDSHLNVKNPTSYESRTSAESSIELENIETSLLEAIGNLRERKRIRGTALTLEDLLNPIEEREIGEPAYSFSNDHEDIITYVQDEQKRLANAEEEVESDEEDEDDRKEVITAAEGMNLCQRLEKLALTHSEAEGVSAVELQRQLRRLCGHLRRVVADSQQQTSLDSYLGLFPT